MHGSWLTTYWIETGNNWGPIGFGVTAWTVEDAIRLIESEGFDVPDDLDGMKIIENVQFKDLDQSYVAHNMGPMVMRGVWYPPLNLRHPPRYRGVTE